MAATARRDSSVEHLQTASSATAGCWNCWAGSSRTSSPTGSLGSIQLTNSPAMTSLDAVAREALLANGFSPTRATRSCASWPVSRRTQPSRQDVRDLRALHGPRSTTPRSRDLDQIEVAEELSDGAIVLRIGIADVDALVPKGSAIDAHAFANATSVYTGVARLSDAAGGALDRPHLAERGRGPARDGHRDGDRAPTARSRRHDVYRALAHQPREARVRERRRVARGTRTGAGQARRRRRARGADLAAGSRREPAQARARSAPARSSSRPIEATPVGEGRQGRGARRDAEESRARADRGLHDRRERRDRAVPRRAQAGRRSGASCARRSAGTGSSRSRATYGVTLAERAQRARAVGLPRRSAARRIRRASPISRSASSSCSAPASTCSTSPARATTSAHFGLAATDYTHSTAPNRRYADLVTQRLVKAALAGAPPPYTDDELAAIARHCTERENAAQRVERTMRKAAAAELLSHRIGARLRRDRHRREQGRHLRAAAVTRPPRDASCAARKGWTSASRCG